MLSSSFASAGSKLRASKGGRLTGIVAGRPEIWVVDRKRVLACWVRLGKGGKAGSESDNVDD